MADLKSAPKTIVLKFDGEKHTIKMYYGLLNEILEQVRDLSNVSNIFTDPVTRNAVIAAVLSLRDDKGAVTLPRNATTVDIDYEEVEKLLNWCATHATGFFVRSLKALTESLQDTFPVPPEAAETISTLPRIGSEG